MKEKKVWKNDVKEFIVKDDMERGVIILLSDQLQELGTPSHDPLKKWKNYFEIWVSRIEKKGKIICKSRKSKEFHSIIIKDRSINKKSNENLYFSRYSFCSASLCCWRTCSNSNELQKISVSLSKREGPTCSLKSLMSLKSLRSLGKCFAPHLCSIGETKFCKKNEEEDEKEFSLLLLPRVQDQFPTHHLRRQPARWF